MKYLFVPMNLLFICNQNQNRSKTCEDMFRSQFDVKSAGLFNEHPVTARQMSWADIIIVMEDSHRTHLAKKFPKEYVQKRIWVFDIPDIYRYMQPELVALIRQKMSDLVLSVAIH